MGSSSSDVNPRLPVSCVQWGAAGLAPGCSSVLKADTRKDLWLTFSDLKERFRVGCNSVRTAKEDSALGI